MKLKLVVEHLVSSIEQIGGPSFVDTKTRGQGDIMSVLLAHEKQASHNAKPVHQVDSSDDESAAAVLPQVAVTATAAAAAAIANKSDYGNWIAVPR